jgi:hypothetical protein
VTGAAWAVVHLAMVIVLLVMFVRRRFQHDRANAKLDGLIAAALASRASEQPPCEIIALEERRR